jgi:hypothetical protein
MRNTEETLTRFIAWFVCFALNSLRGKINVKLKGQWNYYSPLFGSGILAFVRSKFKIFGEPPATIVAIILSPR